jgi:sigma-B regulation protein RsbU (phosphoserine phosphatase)
MLKNRSFAFKISLSILIAVSAIFIISFYINYVNTREIIFNYVEKNAKQTAYLNIAKIEDILNRVEKVPLNFARLIEESELNRTQIEEIIKSIVINNDEIYGSTVSYDAKINSNDKYAPYYYFSDGKLGYADLTNELYDYHNQDWYKIPKEIGSVLWIEPYFDEGAGNILMTTYSVPFYKIVKGKKTFQGIVTADVSLEWLDKIVNSITILKSGFAFLISNDGSVISHPNKQYLMQSFSEYASLRHAENVQSDILFNMLNGKEGIAEYESVHLGKPAYLFYTQLPSSNWTLALVFPKDELYVNLNKLNNNLMIGVIVGILFLIILVITLAKKMTKPLHALSEATTEIAKGNFSTALPMVSSNDEIGKLTKSMEFMLAELNHYIEDLKLTTAEKEKYESELRIAQEIQMGMIPKKFPPFPDKKEIDIYAKLKPAREVGGDLYDFFFLDEAHLCVTIGDVSGKGVPASLLMAVTRTLLRSNAKVGLTSSEIVNRINKSLNDTKESRLFVTYFLLIFNIRTGKLDFTNAGHNPPLLLKANSTVQYLESPQSYPLGISTLSPYESNEIVMNKGDKLFLYTDGITEAQNISDAMYGEEKLENQFKQLASLSASEICNSIFEDVLDFVDTAEQYDDMTVVCLNYQKEN